VKVGLLHVDAQIRRSKREPASCLKRAFRSPTWFATINPFAYGSVQILARLAGKGKSAPFSLR